MWQIERNRNCKLTTKWRLRWVKENVETPRLRDLSQFHCGQTMFVTKFNKYPCHLHGIMHSIKASVQNSVQLV